MNIDFGMRIAEQKLNEFFTRTASLGCVNLRGQTKLLNDQLLDFEFGKDFIQHSAIRVPHSIFVLDPHALRKWALVPPG